MAVVVLDHPVFQEDYARLPDEGLVDTLAMGTEVTIVGYGAQFYVSGGGSHQPVYLRTRYYALSLLIASEHEISDEYIKLTANPGQGKGGICFGDSGGPDLLELGGFATILAINSFATSYNCTGITYSNRIDTADVLEFIKQFLSKR